MSIGKTFRAMRILDSDLISSKALCLDNTIENVNVRDILDEKHPSSAGIVDAIICEDGIGLLGLFIGSVDYVRERVISWVSKWSVMLEILVEIALVDPQCALLAYTFAFQHSWTHLVRTCECEEGWFQPLEYIFVKKFLPTLTGLEYIPPELRETISLPYGEGGFGLVIIGKYIGIQYSQSCRVSAALGWYADINKVKEAQSMMLREIRSKVIKYLENKRATLELKMISVQKCAQRYASEKGIPSQSGRILGCISYAFWMDTSECCFVLSVENPLMFYIHSHGDMGSNNCST
ncbi:hypothetical protein GJ496_010580 [Pomphorhynchus laevis]|nr:hypothetical protein GJ496_010580 [Pomphorhynchus laevis]